MNKQREEDLLGKAASFVVYLVKDNLHYKIGKTSNVQARLIGIQTGNSRKVELMATYSPTNIDYSFLEVKLHEYFKDNRISGEWFNFDISVDEWLAICKDLDN